MQSTGGEEKQMVAELAGLSLLALLGRGECADQTHTM